MATGRSRVDVKSGTSTIPSSVFLDIDVLLMLGVTEWGPLTRQEIRSYPQFQEMYGGLISGRQAPIAVKNLFDMGLKKLLYGRVVHMSGANPASAAKATRNFTTATGTITYGTVTGTVAAPFSIDHGETIRAAVDGGAPGTATFSAVAATMDSFESETYALANGDSLVLKVNGGSNQTVTFVSGDFVDITVATAAEVAAVINAQVSGVVATVATGRVRVTTLQKGTGSSIQCVAQGAGAYGADANSKLKFPVSASTGSGNCANHFSVTLAEVKTWLEAGIGGITVGSSGGYLTVRTNVAGAAGSIQIQAISTADTDLGLDNDLHAGLNAGSQSTIRIDGKYYGSRGNTITTTIEAATSGVPSRFDLVEYRAGVFQKRYPNCTMLATSPDYVVTQVNIKGGGSKLIEVTDLSAGGTELERRPTNVTAQALTGGQDGLSALDYNDFIGSETYRTGLHLFDDTIDGDLLICPDETSAAFQNAATLWCSDDKQGTVVFVPDPPASLDYQGVCAHAGSLTASESRTSLYWPWIKMANPDKTVYGQGDTITVAPSGAVVGRYVKNSELYREKMGKQPGNHNFGALNIATGVEDTSVNAPAVRDYLTDYRVNPIVADTNPETGGFSVWMDDVMSGKATGNWKSVGQIRFVAYVIKLCKIYMNAVRTQSMSERFRRELKLRIEGELLQWVGTDVFASEDASEAFQVDTDPEGESINNPQVQAAETYKVLVGLALSEAGRFGELTIYKDDRKLQQYIQAALTGQGSTT
ncbi:MAG: hypothetical protein FJ098_00585 [Deltaproteobacteria bacterium]|nr:hypothetical protein [Deltaproteobacteria bacterium]